MLNDLLAAIQRLGHNSAPIPLALAYERGQWIVDVDIRTKRRQIDFTYVESDLDEALQKAHRRLILECR